VSFYPKLILGNISYDTGFIQEILYEIGVDINQEEILNTIINITVLNHNRFHREDTIKAFIPCLVDGSLVGSFKEELDTLIHFFIRVSNEIFFILNTFVCSSDKVFFRYINWSTGDVIFSTFELNDKQSTTFKQLFNY
jgi:hypothetical protein